MIGEGNRGADGKVNEEKIAVRDAIVSFLVILVTKLIEAGYPPTPQAIYFAGLGGALMGLVSYMHARGINLPR